MKINLLKVIKLKNTKLKTEIKQLDFLTASIDIGYNKSFTKDYIELNKLVPSKTILLNEDVIKQTGKVNNDNNLFKVITIAPLLKSRPVFSLNTSVTDPLLKQFNNFLIIAGGVPDYIPSRSSILRLKMQDISRRKYRLRGENFSVYIRKNKKTKSLYEEYRKKPKKVFIKLKYAKGHITKHFVSI
jgi:hypothetical protein